MRYLLTVLLFLAIVPVQCAVFDVESLKKNETKTEQPKVRKNKKKLTTDSAPSEDFDGDGDGEEEGEEGEEGKEGAKGEAGFMGIKVEASSNVLFIVDISGSMGNLSLEGRSRIEVMKSELTNSIYSAGRKKKLGEKTGKYRVIAFSSRLIRFPAKGARSFQITSDTQLKKFVKPLNACGGTSMLMAWQCAAEIYKKEDSKFDTVYFLTDGDPTDCNTDMLLDFIKKNFPKELVIHCFSIGQDSDLMKRVAKKYHGKYRKKM